MMFLLITDSSSEARTLIQHSAVETVPSLFFHLVPHMPAEGTKDTILRVALKDKGRIWVKSHPFHTFCTKSQE